MSLSDQFLEKNVCDHDLALVDAVFGQLLVGLHQSNVALSSTSTTHADDLRLYQLQRNNELARCDLAEFFEGLGRIPKDNHDVEKDNPHVTHATRAYGRVSRQD